MRYTLLFSLFVLLTLVAISGCGGSKQVQTDLPPLVIQVPPDTGAKNVDELDYVEVNTDTRINPVSALRYRLLSDGGYTMDIISDSALGCTFPIPKNWSGSRRQFQNLVNYFGNDKISITISVAYRTFDSTKIWAQVQEALSFGKNQMPREDWRLDSSNEQRANWRQSYFGRYNFNNRQFNMAFFEQDSLQYNVITDHPLGSLTEGEAQALNYILANFSFSGRPTVSIPLPVGNIVAPSPTAEDSNAKKKPEKKKSKKKKKGG